MRFSFFTLHFHSSRPEDMKIMMTATLSSPAKKGGKKTVKDEKKVYENAKHI
jgi:hypothetical protein